MPISLRIRNNIIEVGMGHSNGKVIMVDRVQVSVKEIKVITRILNIATTKIMLDKSRDKVMRVEYGSKHTKSTSSS